MRVIGLTGGIASGKSTVSRMLKTLGAVVIDADKIAREIVEPGHGILNQIVEEFGSIVLSRDGTLNRKVLGNIVFNDINRLRMLNSITHPEIRRIIEERIVTAKEYTGNRMIIIDAAILLESGMEALVDEIWLVYADYNTQLKRLMERDGISRDEAAVRISTQMPVEDKMKLSDRVIDNTKDLVYTEKQIKKLWNDIPDSMG